MALTAHQANGLLECVFPEKGKKKPDFLIVQSGQDVLVRGLNRAWEYKFKTKVTGPPPQIDQSGSHCTITCAPGLIPGTGVVVKRNLYGFKTVIIKVQACPSCGQHRFVTIQLPRYSNFKLISFKDEEPEPSPFGNDGRRNPEDMGGMRGMSVIFLSCPISGGRSPLGPSLLGMIGFPNGD